MFRPFPDGSRPWLVLDVDGVIAPFDDERSPAWDDWRPTETNGLPMAYSQKMAERLAAVPADRIWLTTWEADANRCICPELGWEPLPVLVAVDPYEEKRTAADEIGRAPKRPDTTSGLNWWKLHLLALQVASARRDGTLPPGIVWVDDDLADYPEAQSYLDRLEIPTLAIAPKLSVGLTSAEIDTITEFCTALVGKAF